MLSHTWRRENLSDQGLGLHRGCPEGKDRPEELCSRSPLLYRKAKAKVIQLLSDIIIARLNLQGALHKLIADPRRIIFHSYTTGDSRWLRGLRTRRRLSKLSDLR